MRPTTACVRIGCGALPRAAGAVALLANLAFPAEENLALAARASASESFEDLTPEKAIDGTGDTRWSAIPGHVEGIWYELAWDEPVEVGEVIVHQFDRYVTELDLQVRTEDSAAWRDLRHEGRPDERLPRVIAWRFAPMQIRGLRLAEIANGPSFTEVEVFAAPYARGLHVELRPVARGLTSPLW